MKTLKFITLILLSLTLFGIQPAEARGFRSHSGGHHFSHGHRGGHFGRGHPGRHFIPHHRPYAHYRGGRHYNYPYHGYGYGHSGYYYNGYSYPSYRYYGGSRYYR